MRRFLLHAPRTLQKLLQQPLHAQIFTLTRAFGPVLNPGAATTLRSSGNGNGNAEDAQQQQRQTGRPQTYDRKHTPGRQHLINLVTAFTATPDLLKSHSWAETLAHCKQIDFSFNDANFGGHVMQLCLRDQNLAVAAHYVAQNPNPNLTVLSSYLLLLSRVTPPADVDVDLITRLYKDVTAKNKGIWDLVTAERVIPAICKTPAWRDSLRILEAVKVGGSLGTIGTYDIVIAAAFENGDASLGWSFLEEFGPGRPSDRALVACLQSEKGTDGGLERLFDYMDYYEIYPTRKLVEALQEQQPQLEARETKIVEGACARCKTKLESNLLTRQEFDSLAHEFLNRVLETTNVFMNTTPEELSGYKKFMATRTFDVVIDGLNVAYLGQGGKPSVRLLQQTMDGFTSGGSRVLVIGRKHMRRWPGFQQVFDGQRTGQAQNYLINDQSEDDPFLIYAALKSGPACRFVSNDQLRNHTFRLQDRVLARLFKRWRLSRQLYLDERKRVCRFVNVLPVPQKVGSSMATIWHVPFSEERLKSCYEVPDKWICFKHK